MFSDLNAVRTRVYIAREEFPFETLHLYESFNAQPRFEIVRNFGSQQAVWQQDAGKLSELVGEEVYIKFEHTAGGEKNQFLGIVTGVEVSGEASDTAGGIRLIGSGSSILLDGLPEKRSFTDMRPEEILGSILSDYRIPFKCHTSRELRLPYAVQYDETAFSFLDRLSRDYGEWFYYDGYELVFGNPGKQEELMLDCSADVIDLKLGSALRPRNTHKYTYEPQGDLYPDAEGNTPVATGMTLLKKMVGTSDRLFNRKFLTELEAPVFQGSALSILSRRESTSYVSDMLKAEATTHTCRVRLGHYVNFNFPQTMNLRSLGQYVVTEVEHTVNRNGHYENRFTAYPSNPVYVPPKNSRPRKAYPEIATVVDNADPSGQGRVRVRFEWQQERTQTNWIRVQTPDAGRSDAVSTNRGFVFIPEAGDQVMVGYEHGNPARPFVMGSLFHGKNGRGGENENHLKSISTRSGHQIVFDDDEKGDWSITIKDKNGNIINLNTAQQAINISSIEEINLTSKNIKLAADENITVLAGKNYSSTIDGEYSNDVKGNHTESVGKDKRTSVSGKSAIDIEKDLDINVVKNTSVETGNKINLRAGGKANLHTDGKMDITSSVIVHIAQK
ncbi:type VI secretion system Vgr family protein [Porphyromonas macacae]|uniref:type VI secretion system Vgr family protein n=1 Tax=Porphyromonas macacae TaxID=28115 RepID=UPI0024AD8604|nr:phage baseplate assembly protein V [Porphyromonas macacae]